MERTYISYKDVEKRNQIEYKEKTKLLDEKGNLLVNGGWARHNVFDYDRTLAKPQSRGKEWDFYQISDGTYMVQITFANISIGGYAGLTFARVDGKEKRVIGSTSFYLGGKNKYILPANGDVPNKFEFKNKNYYFFEDTTNNKRVLEFKGVAQGKTVEAKFEMDLFENHENISIVTPFKNRQNCFFLTMKQNSMPTSGYFKFGDETINFNKENTFAILDWGRGLWPYKSVWYWGNGSTYITDKDGNKHIFGFEITWGIGDESNATETCIFYDGKAHKFGSIDVDVFPKPDKYLEPWHFVSEDGRFNMTMTPDYDHHSDMNVLKILRMHSHQVHGKWNGFVVLDDGTKLEINNMYAFCEYVENNW